jgi:restriction endonuclease S subunit
LEKNRKTLEEREHGKLKCSKWYGFSRNQNLVQCSKEKILTPSIAKKAAFVSDSDGSYYFLGSGGGSGGGYGLSISSQSNIDPNYLVGLLNSKLLDYLAKKNSSHFSGGFYAYNKQYIESLPIINPKTEAQLALKEQIIDLCKRVLELNRTISTTTDSTKVEFLEREAIVYEEKIDQLVYQLYNITPEERMLIEEANPN